MDINLTLIGQTIAMIVFVWFCVKFIWPPIINAIEERQNQIAEGLAAAEKGEENLYYGLALILSLWGIAILTFGVPGLYIPALAMVPVMVATLVAIAWG